MPIFHRLYVFFPLFLLMLALSGCAEMGSSPWMQGKTVSPTPDQTAIAPYEPVPALQTTDTGAPPVKVAILLPLSGQHAALGQSMLQAAQLAVFDVGYDNFELMPQDTGGTAQGATTAASAALTGGAKIILGPLFAEEVRAVKGATSGRGVNVIAFSTDWTLAGGNTFIMGFLPFGQVERITDFAVTKGLKRAAIVSGADQYGTTVSAEFEKRATARGMTISRALSDANGYDSVFIPAGGSSLSSILQRVTNKSARKLGTGLWDDARIAADPAMNGAWFAAPSPSARASFESHYKSTYGTSPVRLATLTYDATALAAALSKSGGFTSAALTNPNGFAGVDGIIRFNSNGLAERGLAILEIKNGRITEIDPAPKAFTK